MRDAVQDQTSNGPIRVCFPFIGDDLGGSHISVVKLLKGFDKEAIVPTVVLQHATGPLAPFLAREGIPFIDLSLAAPPATSPGKVLLSLARIVPRVTRFLRRRGYHIIHTNDGRPHLYWGLAARLAGAKLVWHHRGDPLAKGTNILAPLLAHQLLTVSHFAKPRRPLLSMDGRTQVVHSPFDRPVSVPDRGAARAALLREIGATDNVRVLGYFGGLIDRKRPLLFVDIIHALRRQHPDLPVAGCLFGAAAPYGRDFAVAVRERAASLGVADVVHLMGFRQPIEPYMAATDVLLVPAVGEPFGRTLIEAMFLGTPVVATDHGGNPEAIENGVTGFLVEPESPDAFVKPVFELLSDTALFARISETAQDAALRSYSVAGHVEKIMNVYYQITTQGRRKPQWQIPNLSVGQRNVSHS